jgi:hypothetical protein
MGNGAEAGGERTTALVVEAEAPLDNLVKVGKRAHGSVRILVGEGADQIYTLGGRHKRDKDHWLVRGMEVPVSIDPAHPADFEILWDEIPSMPQRAAANEPALADPVGTRRKVGEALIAATSAIDTSALQVSSARRSPRLSVSRPRLPTPSPSSSPRPSRSPRRPASSAASP